MSRKLLEKRHSILIENEKIQLSKEVKDLLRQLEKKYQDLVWYSRKPLSGIGKISDENIKSMYKNPDYPCTQENIDSIRKSVEKVYEEYPNEVTLYHNHSHMSDWRHGYNSGILGCVRFILDTTNSDKEIREMTKEITHYSDMCMDLSS